MNSRGTAQLVGLHGAGVSVVVDVTTPVPTIVHWGASVGSDLDGIAAAREFPIANGALDVVAPLSLVPEHGSGHLFRPGLEGHRPDGSDWAPRFAVESVDALERSITVVSVDSVAGLRLTSEIRLESGSDVLRVRATLTNEGSTSYSVAALRPTLPVPVEAQESLTFSGRWIKEFQPVRQPLQVGTVSVENRSGRTSHNRAPIAFVGSSGFREHAGEVWGVHLEWSGNSVVHLDVSTEGRRSIQAAELLMDGEIELAPGSSYSTPWVCGSYSGAGLTRASRRFHSFVRGRAGHPNTERPVTLNIWEAVYFDHNLDVLRSLADVAASIGVERYVVDDGWFLGRRDDDAGLGDWTVDPVVWPEGLGPIADHVVGLGMQFGLWFEPEMINPNSELYRAHPEWVLHDDRYPAVFGRNQLVLDLAREDVRAYLFGQLSALLRDYPISYIKWDHNRELVHASHDRRANVHTHTLGVYALFDQLRAAFPAVEIESCSSGGGRIDFAILERTHRVWTSDCNDPLERQRIQRGYSTVFPPELMGAHIGGPKAHTTRRQHSLGFRASTAIFGHLGIEWNILDANEHERGRLAATIALYKRLRGLLHHGDVTRLDHPNPSVLAHGVLAADRSEAVVSMAMMDSSSALFVEPLRIPELDIDARYLVRALTDLGPIVGTARQQPAWVAEGVVLTGRALASVGLQPPVLDAESVLLLHLVRQ